MHCIGEEVHRGIAVVLICGVLLPHPTDRSATPSTSCHFSPYDGSCLLLNARRFLIQNWSAIAGIHGLDIGGRSAAHTVPINDLFIVYRVASGVSPSRTHIHP